MKSLARGNRENAARKRRVSPYRTFSRKRNGPGSRAGPADDAVRADEVMQLQSLNDPISPRRGDRHLICRISPPALALPFAATPGGPVSRHAALPGWRKNEAQVCLPLSSHRPWRGNSVARGPTVSRPTARVLKALLARWPNTPKVDLVTTDGFLLPNAELRRQGLMERKGFPESYDTGKLLRFLNAIKSGRAEVAAPLYSHLVYDVVPGEEVVIDRPDILIVEGLNVLQPARMPRDGKAVPFVSDFFDFSIYLDAPEHDLQRWYVDRFLRLRHTAFRDPKSYFHRYAELDETAAIDVANGLWNRINLVNLRENVLPTRQRASLILRKGASHHIEEVALRRL